MKKTIVEKKCRKIIYLLQAIKQKKTLEIFDSNKWILLNINYNNEENFNDILLKLSNNKIRLHRIKRRNTYKCVFCNEQLDKNKECPNCDNTSIQLDDTITTVIKKIKKKIF